VQNSVSTTGIKTDVGSVVLLILLQPLMKDLFHVMGEGLIPCLKNLFGLLKETFCFADFLYAES
jgi:hypothetical protein